MNLNLLLKIIKKRKSDEKSISRKSQKKNKTIRGEKLDMFYLK